MRQQYTASDFRKISWDEYGKNLHTLYANIQEYCLKNNTNIDAIVPILRGGNFPGTYLAYACHLLTILPVQYKYLSVGGAFILQKLLFEEHMFKRLKDTAVILVVENNHVTGSTARMAIADIKQLLPQATMLYAATCMDYAHQTMEGAQKIFYSTVTNETRSLSPEQAKEKNVQHEFSLFPWENLNEELAMVNEEEFIYENKK